MYSVPDLPREGLPHSDIRGSTIARISPRLIAACHVLHRLLVPRHPLNALLILISSPPARRTKPHPRVRLVLSCPTDSNATPRHSLLTRKSALPGTRYHQIRFTCKTAWITPMIAHRDGVFRKSILTWRRSDSNRRPPACKAGALPLSYAPTG